MTARSSCYCGTHVQCSQHCPRCGTDKDTPSTYTYCSRCTERLLSRDGDGDGHQHWAIRLRLALLRPGSHEFNAELRDVTAWLEMNVPDPPVVEGAGPWSS